MGLWQHGPPIHPDYFRVVEGGSLMPKSYLPQFLAMAKALSVYFAKHQTTIFKFVTDPTHQAAMQTCITDLNHCLSLFNRPPEQP